MDRLSGTIDTAGTETAPARYLRHAESCRELGLVQLAVVAELVKELGELIHSLQRERGISAIFLGSSGTLFAGRRAAQAAGSEELERRVAERLERIDEQLDRRSPGAGFYVRIAFACIALDSLAATRERISALAAAPQDAVKALTDIIGALLAVGFEAANIAPDPAISRLLIALVSFAQGKEYAGQERATAGAWLSRGRSDPAERRRLRHLQAAQERAFQIFARFAAAEHAESHRESMSGDGEAAELARMRDTIVQARRGGRPISVPVEPASIPVEQWYELTTRRIDRMKEIEARLAADLGGLCAAKLAEARARGTSGAIARGAFRHSAPVAMLVAEVASPAAEGARGIEDGIGLYALEDALPKPMRPILEVIEAQSRHIDDIHTQLESARLALAERKTVERAKGVLMRNRRLSENDAYALMRRTAMRQNKRLHEVAEAILSMADLSK